MMERERRLDSDDGELDEMLESVLELSESEAVRVLMERFGDSPWLQEAIDSVRAYHKLPDILKSGSLQVAYPAPTPIVGTIIDRYRIVEEVGAGGMGIVYRAAHVELGQSAAVKVVALQSEQSIERFLREGKILASMSSPFIAQVHDSGILPDGRPYFVMDFIDGVSIHDHCRDESLDIPGRLRLFCQVCEGVHHSHQRAIIHRDLKPSNVLIERHADSWIPRIVDFGIAKPMEPEADGITLDGQRIGTTAYMSPERLRSGGHQEDILDDVYSLGVVLYELIAGVIPWVNRDEDRVREEILEGNVKPPSFRAVESQSGPRASRDIDNIALAAMAFRRERRYESAWSLKEDVERFLSGMPVRATAPTALDITAKFFRRNWRCAAVFSLIALLAVALAVGFQQRRERRLADYYLALRSARVELEERALGFRRRAFHALAQAVNLDVSGRDPTELRSLYLDIDATFDLELKQVVSEGIEAFALDFSPDGKWLAVGQSTLEGPFFVRVYDPLSGEEISLLPMPHSSRGVRALKFTPDSRGVLSSDKKGSVYYCSDVASGAEFRPIASFPTWVKFIELAGEEGIIYCGSAKEIRRIDYRSGELLEKYDVPSYVSCMQLDVSQHQIVYGGDAGLRVLQAKSLALRDRWEYPTVYQMRIRADRRGVLGAQDGAVVSFHIQDRENRLISESAFIDPDLGRAHDSFEEIRSIDISPDGRLVISGSSDGTAKLWHRGSLELLSRIVIGGTGNVFARFHPGGEFLAVTENQRTAIYAIRASDIGDSKEPIESLTRSLALSRHPQLAVGFAHDAGRLATVSGSKKHVKAAVWRIPTGERLAARSFDGDIGRGIASSVAANKAGTLVTFNAYSQRLINWNIQDDTIRATNGESGLQAIRIQGGNILGIFGDGDRRKLFRWQSDAREAEVLVVNDDPGGNHDFGGMVSAAGFIATGGHNGRVALWSPDGKPMTSIVCDPRDPIKALASNLPVSRLAAGTDSGRIYVVDVTTTRALVLDGSFGAEYGRVRSLAMSPSGDLIAVGDSGRVVRVWGRTIEGTWRQVFRRSLPGLAEGLEFSPDGGAIAVLARGERQIRFWNLLAITEQLEEMGLAW